MTAPDRSGITDFPLAPTGPSTHETLPKSSTSTARHRGEAALMEEQANLRLVIEVAREVWG